MLDLVNAEGLDEVYVDIARTILTVAVLSILVTAPMGAVFIRIFASRLLQKQKKPSTMIDLKNEHIITITNRSTSLENITTNN